MRLTFVGSLRLLPAMPWWLLWQRPPGKPPCKCLEPDHEWCVMSTSHIVLRPPFNSHFCRRDAFEMGYVAGASVRALDPPSDASPGRASAALDPAFVIQQYLSGQSDALAVTSCGIVDIPPVIVVQHEALGLLEVGLATIILHNPNLPPPPPAFRECAPNTAA